MPAFATSDLPPLTPRERDILRLIGDGLSNPEIAERLVVSPQTVKWYVKEVYSKLGVHSRDEALALLDTVAPAAEPAASSTSHNLPAPVTSLIGRLNEITALRALLRDPSVRLVTLLGPPGIGKTRLSVETAHRLVSEFPDGLYFAALAPLSDPTLAGDAILSVLGLEASSSPAVDRIKAFLRNRRVLLVLDNFEHVLPAAPLIGDLLAAAPGVKVLATSREPLRIYGEREYPVPPLDPASEAVALFEARAQAVRPEFAVNEQNLVTVTAICQQLDGLPLAIELAAARMKLFTAHALLGRLSGRLNFLTGGARDAAPRQQTLRAAIAWSYDLLTPDEQRLFARFAVFEGGANLEAFAEICGFGLEFDPFDMLESLVGKSLIQQVTGADGEPRFMMLEMLREFAAEKLAGSGEEAAIREAHARYYLALGTAHAEQVRLPGEWDAYLAFKNEYPNIRAAWLVAFQQPESERLLAAAWAIKHVFGVWSWPHEGMAMVTAALKSHRGTGTLTEANLLIGWACYNGTLKNVMGDEELAALNEAVAICERLDRRDHLPDALINLMGAAWDRGDMEEAERLAVATWQLGEEFDLRLYKDMGRTNVAVLRLNRGDSQGARVLLEQTLAEARPHQMPNLTASLVRNLQFMDLEAGDIERARAWTQELVKIADETREPVHQIRVHSALADFAFLDGDWAEAYHHSLMERAINEQLEQENAVEWVEMALAAIAAMQGELALARQHLSVALKQSHNLPADAFRDKMSTGVPYVAFCAGLPERAVAFAAFGLHLEGSTGYQRLRLRPLLAELEAHLTPETYAAAWARGEAMDIETAMELAQQLAAGDTS